MATMILKATEACNARCVYCDVVRKERPPEANMPLETLEQLFVRVNEFLLKRIDESMDIIWHGGEPLLLGSEYFARALEFQEKHCPATSSRVRHTMQSNLTLFSREFTDVFRKLGIGSLGSSYDPIPGLRGLGKNVDSDAYNRRFLKAIRLLEEAGFRWGTIYVVTKLSLQKPLEIFHFLANLRPGGGIMFNSVLIYGDRSEDLAITPEEFVDFLGEIFPFWWRHRNRYPDVEPFRSLTLNLIENENRLTCADSGNCADYHFNLAPDGTVSQCGRSSDWDLLDYGSIFDRSLSAVLADPLRDELRRRNKFLAEGECNGCRFWPICHGGCPLDAWAEKRSFLHKSSWCYAKKGFIEKYFEPVTGLKPRPPASAMREEKPSPNNIGVFADGHPREAPGREKGRVANDLPWINPIGGFGDTLMLSGVLKQVIELDPSRKFNLVTRTKYAHILQGHPAIAEVGHPPPGAWMVGTAYWAHDEFARPGKRAYQILARMFGLPAPVEERLYVPWKIQDDPLLLELIPWKGKNVLISPTSESPRKEMKAERWESLVERLRQDGVNVVQAGRRSDRYIRGCYSLLGLTAPRQVVALLSHFDAVATLDNFIMHAARLCDIPAVVLWGPTDHRVYGYPGQAHLQADIACEEECVGPEKGHLYVTECPREAGHCLDQIEVEKIYRSVRAILDGNRTEPKSKNKIVIPKISPA
jgi:uncharacterized protein